MTNKPGSNAPPTQWLLRSRLKMRQLLLLSALGDHGHLGRSAAQVGMTQPAASKLLNDLESALGVQLFERSRRGMAPTLYGQTMVRFARGLLADMDAVREELLAMADGAVGTLTVGLMTSTASQRIPHAVVTLLAQHPGIRVSLMEGSHAMLMDALKRGDLDMVLGRVMGGGALDDVDLDILYEDEFVIVCGPRHPLLKAKKLRWSDLTKEQWILPHSTTPLRQRLEFLFMEQAGERPRNALESVSVLTNLALLQQSKMLTVMSADVVRQFSDSGMVRALPVAVPGLFGPVALITRANRRPSPVTDAFIEHLKRATATAPKHAQPKGRRRSISR
jgi:DNA-binding transcriptional LysR family regulator